jgi:hypothetical protein
VKNRRGPWLSGLIAAGIGAVWMIGQVIGGVVSMITDTLSLYISDGAAISAPAVSTQPASQNSAALQHYSMTVRGGRDEPATNCVGIRGVVCVADGSALRV